MDVVIRINMSGDSRLIPPGTLFWIRPPWRSILVGVVYSLAVLSASGAYREDNLEDDAPYIIPSISTSCYTRCVAKCEDTAAGISPPVWNMPEELLTEVPVPSDLLASNSDVCKLYYCRTYLTADWMAYCAGDADCVMNCLNLTTFEAEQVEPPCEPAEVFLEQLTPYIIELSWEPAITSTQHQVVYVVQRSHTNNKARVSWLNINSTMSTVMTVQADPCDEIRYRVTAYNQYGTHGASREVFRTDLPEPGPILYLGSNVQMLESDQYFEYVLQFQIPSDWSYEDITAMDLYQPITGNCAYNFLPPTATSPEFIQDNERNWTFVVYFYETAYPCSYYTKIRVITQCGVLGEYFDVVIRLEDCTAITNFDCPVQPYDPPGVIENITALTTAGHHNVTFAWLPPRDQGSEVITGYVVQWGPLYAEFPNPHLKLDEEHTVSVPWNKTTLDVLVDQLGVEYGVKVVAVDDTSQAYVNSTLGMISVFHTFNIPEAEPEPEDDNTWIINIFVPIALSVVAVIAIISAIYIAKRHHAAKQSNVPHSLRGDVSKSPDGTILKTKMENCMVANPLYEDLCEFGRKLIEPDQWEIPANCLTLGSVLGSGAFGQVIRGTLRVTELRLPGNLQTQERGRAEDDSNYPQEEIVVAVKMLHDYAGSDQRQDFLKEMCLMKQLVVHPNIVSMIGCCTQGEPLCLVVEHVGQGDLLHYLRTYRHFIQHQSEEATDVHLTFQDLLSFARQITVGMEYLSQKGFVHRDLATRNVMVGDNGTMKIGDFGLTRYIYSDKLYVAGRGARLPIKWMAIESIEEYSFDTATDVWSFGVLLFELTTLGGTPYPTIPNRHLLKELKAGYRMERPDNCTPHLYRVMCNCWQPRPSDRPTFTDLKLLLEDMISRTASTEYLQLFLDETRDYYQINTEGSSASSSIQDPQDHDDVVTVRPERSPSEDTHEGADSGMGDKSSVGMSQTTLPSTSSVVTLPATPESPMCLPVEPVHGTSDNPFCSHDSTGPYDPLGPSSLSNDVRKKTTNKKTRTKESSSENQALRDEAPLGSHQAQKSNGHRSLRGKGVVSSSLPILFHLHHPRHHGAESRTSTSSTEQLLPGYSGSSLSGGTVDSGSHSWFGETNV